MNKYYIIKAVICYSVLLMLPLSSYAADLKDILNGQRNVESFHLDVLYVSNPTIQAQKDIAKSASDFHGKELSHTDLFPYKERRSLTYDFRHSRFTFKLYDRSTGEVNQVIYFDSKYIYVYRPSNGSMDIYNKLNDIENEDVRLSARTRLGRINNMLHAYFPFRFLDELKSSEHKGFVYKDRMTDALYSVVEMKDLNADSAWGFDLGLLKGNKIFNIARDRIEYRYKDSRGSLVNGVPDRVRIFDEEKKSDDERDGYVEYITENSSINEHHKSEHFYPSHLPEVRI